MGGREGMPSLSVPSYGVERKYRGWSSAGKGREEKEGKPFPPSLEIITFLCSVVPLLIRSVDDVGPER